MAGIEPVTFQPQLRGKLAVQYSCNAYLRAYKILVIPASDLL